MKNKTFFKKIQETITSEKFLLNAVFVFLIIALTGILASKHYFFQSIIENGLSKRTIFASKKVEVVDTEKTERRKRDILRRVEPILTPLQDEHIVSNYHNLILSIEQVRAKEISFAEKRQELYEILDIEGNNKSVVNFLLTTSKINLDKINTYGEKALAKSLDIGISEKDLSDHIDMIILKNTNVALSKNNKKAILLIVKQVILPNMEVDELATEITKQNAINSIKPSIVTFDKGEQIVFEGEFVSKLKKDALRKSGYTISELNPSGILGILGLILITTYSMYFYLKNMEAKYRTLPYVSLMALLTLFMAVLAIALPYNVPIYIMPFAAFATILAIFTNPRISLLASILLLVSIGASLHYSVEVMSLFIISIMSSVFAIGKMNFLRRMNLVKTGIVIALVQAYIIFTIYIMNSNLYSLAFVSDVVAAITSGILCGVIALGVVPLLESMFKIITPYGLSELADHNQVLLKRLQFEAPGTYHHSLLVSNLAEAAAEAVGGDPILARVGSFYHDIGKLKRPLFFIENQSYFSIENPHEKLNPRLSKMVITAHPKDGIEIAKEYGLPSIIHNFILQHHGDSMATYFYNQARAQEGEEEVKKEQFRYTCPKPNMKETAILMLADATEGVVRTLNNPTPEEMEQAIDKIIQDRLMDGQLSDSPLTQRDLKTISQTFVRVLKGMQHHRIKYQDNMMDELEQKVQQQKENGNTVQIAKTVEKQDESQGKAQKAKENNDDKSDKQSK